MTDVKDTVYETIAQSLHGRLSVGDIHTVIDSVVLALADYKLEKVSRDIVLYRGDNKSIIDKFIVSKSVEGATRATVKTYRTTINLFLKFVKKPVDEVCTDDVRVYMAFHKMRGKSSAYLALIQRALSSFYAWCENNDMINVNPMRKIGHIKVVKKLKKPFTEDEMELLRKSAKSLRDRAMIEFLYSTGCRVSEMCQLDAGDIDFDNCKAVVLGKGQKYREVYISARCKSVLSEYLDSRTDLCQALFVSRIGTRICQSSVQRTMRDLGRLCGIENVHPHRFRRTAATLALKRGMPIEQVQKMLGHEDIGTTTIYAQSDSQDVQLAHNKYVI